MNKYNCFKIITISFKEGISFKTLAPFWAPWSLLILKLEKAKGGPFLLNSVSFANFFFFKAIGSLWFWRKPGISKKKQEKDLYLISERRSWVGRGRGKKGGRDRDR